MSAGKAKNTAEFISNQWFTKHSYYVLTITYYIPFAYYILHITY